MRAYPYGARRKSYLGDAVYAEVNDFGEIILTADDGVRATNRIILEPEVREVFIEWMKQCAAGLPRGAKEEADETGD